MICVDVPGWRSLCLEFLVLDVNGTLTLDGELLPGVPERLSALGQKLKVMLLTADTYGKAREVAESLGVGMQKVGSPGEREAKERFVRQLGLDRVVAIGNGANDVAMLREVTLGIGVLGPEGTCAEVLQVADVVVTDIRHALDLLLFTKRLIATLRR